MAGELHKTFPPLSCLLKLDGIRRLLKDRHENSVEAASLTFKIGQAIVETCLKEGKDVIVERAMKDPKVIDQFVQIGQNNNAEVFEFILWADKETILDRNATREDAPDGLPDSRRITPEKATEFWEKINGFKNDRVNATIINVRENTLEQVVEKIKGLVI